MLSAKARQLVKDTLSFSRARVIYARITLTRYTTLFFFFALLSALVLLALEAVAYNDNTMAIKRLDGIIAQGSPTTGVFLQQGDTLQVCYDVPGRANTKCRPLWKPHNSETFVKHHDRSAFETRATNGVYDGHDVWDIQVAATTVEDALSGETVKLDTACIESLEWLSDVLKDSRREDFVTGAFHIWLFSVAAVTILNESLPHLLASGVSHVLATAWAGYRIHQTADFQSIYHRLIASNEDTACGSVDILGPWWDTRISHAIPIVIFNSVALLWFITLSLQLFKVYAHQSFSRVGASPKINRVYKIVLSLSVALQLALFFTLAATAMWIDKIATGNIRRLAFHSDIYKAAFIITAIFEVPWIVLGWTSVRKERRKTFLLFAAISGVLLGIFSAMFFSPLYRYVLGTWPFFATMSVLSYILIIATSALGVFARMHFGRGLKHFLEVSDALEDVDFTPVYFSNDPKKQSIVSVSLPTMSYTQEKAKRSSIDKDPEEFKFMYPPPPEPAARSMRQETASLYSRAPSTPRKITMTPRFLRDSYVSKVSSKRDSLVSRVSTKVSTAAKAHVSQVSLVSRRASTESSSSAGSDATIASISVGRSSFAKSTISALPALPVPSVPPMNSRKLGLPGNPRPGAHHTTDSGSSGQVSRSPPKAGYF